MSAETESKLNNLILGIYRTAEDPLEWQPCLERIRLAMEADGLAVLHQDSNARA